MQVLGKSVGRIDCGGDTERIGSEKSILFGTTIGLSLKVKVFLASASRCGSAALAGR